MLILWQPRLKGAKSWKFKVGTHQGLKNNESILIYLCELLEEIITVHTAFLAFLSNINVRVCVCVCVHFVCVCVYLNPAFKVELFKTQREVEITF